MAGSDKMVEYVVPRDQEGRERHTHGPHVHIRQPKVRGLNMVNSNVSECVNGIGRNTVSNIKVNLHTVREVQGLDLLLSFLGRVLQQKHAY